MQINKNYQSQNFNGNIANTKALKRTLSNALIGPTEKTNPTYKMLLKLKKNLPNSTTLHIYNFEHGNYYKISGTLSSGDFQESLDIFLRSRRNPKFTTANFTTLLFAHFLNQNKSLIWNSFSIIL